MSFNELVLAMESAEDRYELTMEKTCQVIDHAFDSFTLLCEEIELELLTEAGNTKSADKDKASEGLLVKIGNAIKYFIETLKNFVLDIVDSVTYFFSKEDNKKKIGEIDQIVNSNPELKSKKINIPDEKAISKLVDEYSDKAQREITMIKAGRKPNKTAKQLESEFDSKKSTAIKATAVITLSAAIGLLIAFTKKSKKDYHNETKVDEAVKTIEKSKDSIKKDIDPDSTKHILDFTKFQMKLAKTRAKAVCDFAKDVFDGVRAGITGKKAVNPSLEKIRKEHKSGTFESSEEDYDLNEYYQTVVEEVESTFLDDEDAIEVDESFFTIQEELQEEIDSLRLEIFEAAHNGDISEEEKDQFLSFLNLENYGY